MIYMAIDLPADVAMIDVVGIIASWLDEDDPRSAAEQIDANYDHGGGWRPYTGFTLDLETGRLSHPGDPDMMPLAATVLHREAVIFYARGWAMIGQPDGKWEIARVD